MYFLIGVIILIVFIIILYFILHIRLRKLLDQSGFQGMNLRDIIEQARLEDQEVPKSLASMDRIYLSQIKKDFVDININELKRKAEGIILDCYQAIEKKDTSHLKGKIKSFADKILQEYQGKNVKFQKFKIHNTVVSDYRKENGIASIYFSTAYEYYLNVDGNMQKTQDRARCEFIYIIDEKEIPKEVMALGIHCPNCGSPITSLGEKTCSYCGSAVKEIIHKVFTCNDVVRY